jgi:hypothetical protein
LSYQDEDTGGFKTAMEDTSANQMSSESAARALVGYSRFIDNKASLYDMSDIELEPVQPVSPPSSSPVVKPSDKPSGKLTGTPQKKRKVKLKKLSPKKITRKTKSIKLRVTKGTKLTLMVKGMRDKTAVAKKSVYTFKKLKLQKSLHRIIFIHGKKKGYENTFIRLTLKR